MSAPLASLKFRLEDEIQGQPLSPATVDLPTLRGFLDEVEKLIKGDVAGASLADSRVQIEDGSLKVVILVASLLAESLNGDLTRLRETGDLDRVQPRRADVLEIWQSRARRNPSRCYTVQEGETVAPGILINAESRLEHRGENAWVAVEKYVTGKVIDMGGKQTPNVHLVLEGLEPALKISATEGQLAGEPHLYQTVTLRVTADQHLETKQLRNVHLIEFLPASQEVDEGALTRLWEKGRTAWRGVADATMWVEELRGN